MKTTKQQTVSREQGKAVLEHAITTLANLSDFEAVRAAHWQGLPAAARLVAVWQAGLPKERANDPIKSFNAVERRKIQKAMMQFSQAAEIIVRCMTGGDNHQSKAVH